jgi:hypothetical protein
MAAGKYSFVIEQGATLSFELQYKDSTGTPIDLTGYNGRMQIRPTVESSTVIFQLTDTRDADGTGLNFSGSNGTTPTASGSIGVYISAYSSSLLSFGQAVYDLEIYSGSSYPVVTRLLEGQVKLSREVTR